jgi:hypothetical protein
MRRLTNYKIYVPFYAFEGLTSGHMGKYPYDHRIWLVAFSVAHGQQKIRLDIKWEKVYNITIYNDLR